MAVTMVIDLPKMDHEKYGMLMREAGLPVDRSSTLPPGLLVHVASETEDGWRLVDVWKSEQDFTSFLKEKLGASLQRVGLALEQLPTFHEVRNLLVSSELTDDS